MANVTNVRDARALRSMGLPLNTEVKDGGTLSAEYSRRFRAILESYSGVIGAVIKQDSDKLLPAFQKFMRQVSRARAAKLTATHERAILNHFLQTRVQPAAEFWDEIIETLFSGKRVRVRREDIPRLLDE
jgi:hypothetical protein